MKENNKLTKEAKGYIVCNGLNKVIDLFISTFLVAYLLNITGGNILQISLYYLFVYIGMIVFYSLASYLLHNVNKLYVYRISLVLKCLFLMLIAILREDVAKYIIPIAILYSIESGLYWSSYNCMMTEAISSKSVHKFYGVYNIVGYIVSIVAPIALGFIIDAGSFVKTSIYAFIVCLLIIISTFLLKNRKEENGKLDLKGFINSVTKYKKDFISCYLMCFFNGLRNSTSTIITILIVLTFNSNVSLGSLSSIMAIVGIIVTYLFMKLYKSKYSKILYLCFALSLIGVIAVALDINKVTIVLFNVLYTIAMIIPDNLYSQRRMGIIRITKNHKYAMEHNMLAEASLNAGRVVSYAFLLIGSYYGSIDTFKVLLVINIVMITMYCFYNYVLERRYNGIVFKNDVEKHLKEVEEDCDNYYFYKDSIHKEIN